MTVVRLAAVQATYVLMDREATIDRVADLTASAAAQGAQVAVFPEVFVPSPATDRLGAIVEEHGLWLVVGVEEREANGGTIYNTLLYFSPVGVLIERHRKLMPTGAERTVWGMGDGSTLRVVDTAFGRIGGLICWENYMPLARFHMYAQGVDIWLAPTLATGDRWIATLQHIARENRMFVVGVNPVLHADQIPTNFPRRDLLVSATYREENGDWLEPGNTAIVGPNGDLIAGPMREREDILIADLDLGEVLPARRHMDPVGHYNRADVFRLLVDTSSRPVVVETTFTTTES